MLTYDSDLDMAILDVDSLFPNITLDETLDWVNITLGKHTFSES